MKSLKRILTMIISMPAIAESSPNESRNVINGSYKVSGSIIAESIKINGEATLEEGTVVKNNIIINGKIKASGVTFESELITNGASTLRHCIFRNDARFSGNVAADDCHFFENFTLLAQQATFSNCKFNNIIIKKIPRLKVAQVIRLQKGSVLTGNVTFEAENGEVYIDSSSQIKGVIQGGKIISN